jgi:hypothetical protein
MHPRLQPAPERDFAETMRDLNDKNSMGSVWLVVDEVEITFLNRSQFPMLHPFGNTAQQP